MLLNLLNELGKRDNMRDLPRNLSLFRNEFNEFNNTRARMLDSIYYMTSILHSWRKRDEMLDKPRILSLVRNEFINSIIQDSIYYMTSSHFLSKNVIIRNVVF